MNLRPFLLVIPLLLATAAAAQTQTRTELRTDSAQCGADEALLMEEMDTARSRGRMLQRRQLAEQLAALQARCGSRPPVESREASITRVQDEILALRRELDRTEAELRKLRQGL